MWWNIAWFAGGVAFSVMGLGGVAAWRRRRDERSSWASPRLQRFFRVKDPALVEVRERSFSYHVAPDAKLAIDRWFEGQSAQPTTFGVPLTCTFMEHVGIGSLMSPRGDEQRQLGSPEYETFDVGKGQVVECPRHVLWLVELKDCRLAMLWTNTEGRCSKKLRIEIGYVTSSPGRAVAEAFFAELEQAIEKGSSYRGKVLSFEPSQGYGGDAGGITVHDLKHVDRDDVILPVGTVALLDRNLLRFVKQRGTLKAMGMPAKKGLLFYGPPGTGKTHTIHYLLGALEGHTTLLVTAEQIGALSEYMTLARLLQPSIVVMEDVDLIAQDRDDACPGQQSLLNRLLNEMDGLAADAEIIFVLTTNRTEALESALAARPGRVDQAVEFPPPDGPGREKLVRLYARGARISPAVVRETVRQTDGVSASFIKELMRRALQFHLECSPDATEHEILQNDVDQAIEELLWSGGALNRALLGAGGRDSTD